MRRLLILAGVLFAALLAATQGPAWADPGLSVSVSPDVVDVGLNFAGDDVRIYGAIPEDADVVVKVDGPTESVKLSKKGKVLGLFWMTVDRAEVENMPALHLVHSSAEIDNILSREEQIRLGVDPMSSSAVSQARAVDPDEGGDLPEAESSEFIAGLRDMYIREGRYASCVSCHSAPTTTRAGYALAGDASAPSDGVVHVEDGEWETWVDLPSDAPLGEYTVDSYGVRDGHVIESGSATFTVRKVGLVDSLGSMAVDNAAAYGALGLGIIIAVGMTIGFIFPKRRGGH
jgi:hypothetical protein